ncbi:AMP-binding protein [Dickeya dadantii]|uniref:AMP-binding protein n=1 Tax=Dickeya dadantii TaxID=204038 RepID=UPI001CF1B994|nr:AMP-binding protein [Dickeya dadantii]MCA7014964.1 AMP-binding protein [Dickeya dadantii]
MLSTKNDILSVPDALFRIVNISPNKTAIVSAKKEISYQSLWETSSRIASVLKDCGINKGDVISLKIERDIELYILLVAILRLGAVIAPVGAGAPASYINEILLSSHAKLYIHNDGEGIHTDRCSTLTINALFSQQPSTDIAFCNEPLSGDDPAIIFMTSGSTGHPKSVWIRHSGLSRLSIPIEQLGNNAQDRYLQLSDVAFAASANEIWMSMLTGATLIVVPSGLPDLLRIEQWVAQYSITQLFLSGGLFRLLVETSSEIFSLNCNVIVSGDFVNPRLFIHAAQIGPARIFNGFGCTENSAISSLYQIRPEQTFSEADPIPVGTPLPCVEMVVLNQERKRCYHGEQGELYIGGSGVALGYSRTASTTATFFEMSWQGQRQRFYRTADKATYDADGNIVVLGRQGHICKVRGFRVDITGIEHVLRSHPEIEDVVVTHETTSEESRLHACYVTTSSSLSEDEVSRFLQAHLPHYMIPEKFTRISAIPMTFNGKRDRREMGKRLAAGEI